MFREQFLANTPRKVLTRCGTTDFLLVSIASRSPQPPWASSCSTLLAATEPEQRFALYRQFGESGALHEDVLTFLVVREAEFLVKCELDAAIHILQKEGRQLLQDHGFAALAPGRAWMPFNVHRYVDVCPVDWQRRLASTLRRYGQGSIADFLERDPSACRAAYANGWRELYSAAHQVEGAKIPHPSMIDLAEAVLPFAPTLADQGGVAVNFEANEDGPIVHLVPFACSPAEPPPEVAAVSVNVDGLCGEFDKVYSADCLMGVLEGMRTKVRIFGSYRGHDVMLHIDDIRLVQGDIEDPLKRP